MAQIISLIDRLPKKVYIKMTNQLSVNDIENLRKSTRDSRTTIAFANLEHAVIYQPKLQDPQQDGEKLDEWLSKLPKSIKTIEVRHRNIFDRWIDIKKLAQKFPNLIKLPYGLRRQFLEYIKNVVNSKLEYIYHEGSLQYDLFESVEASPNLKVLKFSL